LDRPQVLSTNRHIMQGLLDPVAWNANDNKLSGTTRVSAGDPIVLTLAANGHVPGNTTASSGTIETTREGDLVKLKLASKTTDDVQWSITWKK
jgi:hypothetical protein